jgi:hypothetical protein
LDDLDLRDAQLKNILEKLVLHARRIFPARFREQESIGNTVLTKQRPHARMTGAQLIPRSDSI